MPITSSFKIASILCFLFVLTSPNAHSQINHSRQWVLNNYTLLDFSGDSLKVGVLPNPNPALNPGDYSTSICDSTGKLLFYTGGCYVLNSKNQLMENGDSITSDETLEYWCNYNDFPIMMNNTIIPYPGGAEKYIILNYDFEDIFGLSGAFPVPDHLYYHIVDMSLGNGSGKVILT